MPAESPLHAADLRRRLAAVRALRCDMAHERVAADAPPNPLDPGSFLRPGLCAAGRRRQNLACTHGPARAALRDALRVLAAAEGAAGWEAELAALAGLDQGLGPLDHRRYEAETRLAAARLAGDGPALAAARSEVEGTVAAHREMAAALSALRTRALAGLAAAVSR